MAELPQQIRVAQRVAVARPLEIARGAGDMGPLGTASSRCTESFVAVHPHVLLLEACCQVVLRMPSVPPPARGRVPKVVFWTLTENLRNVAGDA